MENCFEDETGKSPEELTQEEFNNLSDELKWLAFENVIEMFYGISGELEQQNKRYRKIFEQLYNFDGNVQEHSALTDMLCGDALEGEE
ncbi:hypothetical protein [Virgibacillus chiguensis]|uniref:Uncharacterized protein n=1 Tax=Virgibacillus chiguensis TaxID=411959 RepID=A0A1M5MYY5_9BACI|nr:hypothetical protein [Virgibacillus chiguensis]SHG82425.1 hypothetical protein SAMN05421807_1024 [Virgibacillus chiguensis]